MSSQQMVGRGAAPNKASFLARLHAWWEGYELPALGGAAPAHPTAADEEADRPTIPPLDPLLVKQWLWGNGFVMPGDAEYMIELVKPFGLSPAMSMLDLNAGLGGGTRAIAASYNTYVTGLERDPEVARRGMELLKAANLGKKASVAHYDPASFELRPNAFDCVLSRGGLHLVADKERFLRTLLQGMKTRGQLLLSELVVEPAQAGRPELAAWIAHQKEPVHLWSLAQFNEGLHGLGFDIRIAEDSTEGHRARILRGWQNMIGEVDLRGLAKPHLVTVLDELENWTKGIAALECGALKVYRIYALATK